MLKIEQTFTDTLGFEPATPVVQASLNTLNCGNRTKNITTKAIARFQPIHVLTEILKIGTQVWAHEPRNTITTWNSWSNLTSRIMATPSSQFHNAPYLSLWNIGGGTWSSSHSAFIFLFGVTFFKSGLTLTNKSFEHRHEMPGVCCFVLFSYLFGQPLSKNTKHFRQTL